MKLTGSSRLSGRGSRSGNAFPSSDHRHQRIDFRSPQADWGSIQRAVLLVAVSKPALLYASRPILEEYRGVLSRPELRIRKGSRQQLLPFIKNHSYSVFPARRIPVTSDPDDNIFLECAAAARADYPVTGNQKHFPKFWKKTEIITPWEFIGLIAPHRIK